MNPAEIFFAIGNAALLVAAYPLIKEAWSNRKKLTGFSFRGSSLTLGAVIFIATGYLYMNSWINILLVLPTILFWGIVAWYSRPERNGGV